MKNELQVFNNEEFGSVRTLTIDNQPWFVGKDVAEILKKLHGGAIIIDPIPVDESWSMRTLVSASKGSESA